MAGSLVAPSERGALAGSPPPLATAARVVGASPALLTCFLAGGGTSKRSRRPTPDSSLRCTERSHSVLEAMEQSAEYPTRPVARLAQHEALASSWRVELHRPISRITWSRSGKPDRTHVKWQQATEGAQVTVSLVLDAHGRAAKRTSASLASLAGLKEVSPRGKLRRVTVREGPFAPNGGGAPAALDRRREDARGRIISHRGADDISPLDVVYDFPAQRPALARLSFPVVLRLQRPCLLLRPVRRSPSLAR